MITFVRTAQALPGKIGDAVAWGKEIAATVKRITGKDVAVCAGVGGPISEIAWIAHYDSMGQAEEVFGKLMADREYMTLVSKAQPLFIPGSGHDRFWKHL